MIFWKAITYLFETYNLAKDDKSIRKPIAWSFYQTWKMVDEKEKARKVEEQEG